MSDTLAKLDYPFVAIPTSLRDAIQRGELLGPRAYIAIAVRMLTWEGVLATTLHALSDRIGWWQTEDSLRKHLIELRRAGWIDYDDPQRIREARYVLRAPEQVDYSARHKASMQEGSSQTLRNEAPLSSEVTSDRLRSTEGASAGVKRDSATSEPQTRGGSPKSKSLVGAEDDEVLVDHRGRRLAEDEWLDPTFGLDDSAFQQFRAAKRNPARLDRDDVRSPE